jgi:aspartate aminotransferase/aminotransferase
VQKRGRLRDLAKLAQDRGVLLISDEIYRYFCYDEPFASPAEFNEETLVIDGFSKSHAMTGWRLGYADGPKKLIEEMTKLQQISYVCAPSMVQHAGIVAWDHEPRPYVSDYRRKRDRICAGLAGSYEIVRPEGAFYVFPRAPWGTATEFVTHAIEHNLLLIPGGVFSRRDTHFRISYAAADQTIERALEVLKRIRK